MIWICGEFEGCCFLRRHKNHDSHGMLDPAPALWMLEREPKHHLREPEGQGLWLDAMTGADWVPVSAFGLKAKPQVPPSEGINLF